jgi:hypothetical protein
MVNNSTNINKTKNTSRLNPLNIIKVDNLLYDVRNPGLGHTQNCGRVKPVIGTLSLFILISKTT